MMDVSTSLELALWKMALSVSINAECEEERLKVRSAFTQWQHLSSGDSSCPFVSVTSMAVKSVVV